jgi:hypothetical protein
MIESRYVPVPIKLEARESINSKFNVFNLTPPLTLLSPQTKVFSELICSTGAIFEESTGEVRV